MANNQALAQIRGVDTTYLQYLTWAVASALAALAGHSDCAHGTHLSELGWDQVLVISAAAIIRWAQEHYGVMLAAVLVGLTSSLATLAIPPEYTQMVVFAAIALARLRPARGLFTGRRSV